MLWSVVWYVETNNYGDQEGENLGRCFGGEVQWVLWEGCIFPLYQDCVVRARTDMAGGRKPCFFWYKKEGGEVNRVNIYIWQLFRFGGSDFAQGSLLISLARLVPLGSRKGRPAWEQVERWPLSTLVAVPALRPGESLYISHLINSCNQHLESLSWLIRWVLDLQFQGSYPEAATCLRWLWAGNFCLLQFPHLYLDRVWNLVRAQ